MSSALGVGSFGQASGRHCAASPSGGGVEVVRDPGDVVEPGGVVVVEVVDRDAVDPDSSVPRSEHPLVTARVTTVASATHQRTRRPSRPSIIART